MSFDISGVIISNFLNEEIEIENDLSLEDSISYDKKDILYSGFTRVLKNKNLKDDVYIVRIVNKINFKKSVEYHICKYDHEKHKDDNTNLNIMRIIYKDSLKFINDNIDIIIRSPISSLDHIYEAFTYYLGRKYKFSFKFEHIGINKSFVTKEHNSVYKIGLNFNTIRSTSVLSNYIIERK